MSQRPEGSHTLVHLGAVLFASIGVYALVLMVPRCLLLCANTVVSYFNQLDPFGPSTLSHYVPLSWPRTLMAMVLTLLPAGLAATAIVGCTRLATGCLVATQPSGNRIVLTDLAVVGVRAVGLYFVLFELLVTTSHFALEMTTVMHDVSPSERVPWPYQHMAWLGLGLLLTLCSRWLVLKLRAHSSAWPRKYRHR